MCAGTVVEPVGPTSAGIDSVTSTSRSVALKVSFDFSALINTLARIGMVLRRSTTRWTWPSDFNSAARSTVTFIFQSARSRGKVQKGVRKVACARVFRKGDGAGEGSYPTDLAAVPGCLSSGNAGKSLPAGQFIEWAIGALLPPRPFQSYKPSGLFLPVRIASLLLLYVQPVYLFC